MRRPALVIGEVLVDVIDSPRGSVAKPGGSPANVAIGLARLNVPAELLSAVADDAYGAQIKAWVQESGVAFDSHSARLDRTSVARAVLDIEGAARYEFDIEWTLPHIPASLIAERSIVHVGSLALFLEPGANEVKRIVAHAVALDIPISIDANIRPSALPAPESARTRFEAIAQSATIVKLSDEDAAFLYPELKEHEVVRNLHELGGSAVANGRIVALTLGGRGALLRSAGGEVHAGAPRVDVVDTIGAGDSFMSGLLARLLSYPRTEWRELDTLEDIGAYAVRCAAITVGREGADPPRNKELAAS